MFRIQYIIHWSINVQKQLALRLFLPKAESICFVLVHRTCTFTSTTKCAAKSHFKTQQRLPTLRIILRPHTLRPHNLRPQTLRLHTLRPTICVSYFAPHTLCLHTLCHHILRSNTLCTHALLPHTVRPNILRYQYILY